MPIHVGSIICRAPCKMKKWGPPLFKWQKKSSSKGTTEWRFSLSPAVSLSTCHSVVYLLFNVTILPAQEYLQSEPSVQQLGRASQASPLPQVQQAPHRPQEHCNLHTRRDLDWVLRLGWVRGVTPLRYRSDTPGCRQLYQCPVLRHRRLLFQTPSLPFQGLKAAAIAGAGAQRKSAGLWGPTKWGCEQWRTEENPSQGGSHPNQGFQFRDAAPLSCQTALTKHKFKQKDKDFKSGKSGYWAPTESSSNKPMKPALIHVKTQGLCSRLQDAH